MALQRRLRLITEAAAVAPSTLRIAFATRDLLQVNQHFGSAQRFAIYRLNAQSCQLEEAAQFGHLAQDGNEDKLAAKLAVLKGCAAVYCQAAGSSAIRQLLAIDCQPVKVADGSAIDQLLAAIQTELRQGPTTPWLAKAAAQRERRDDARRFEQMGAEEWDEEG